MHVVAFVAPWSSIRVLVMAGIRDLIRPDVAFVGLRAVVIALEGLQRAPGEGDEQNTQERRASQHGGEATPHRGEKTTRMRHRQAARSQGTPPRHAACSGPAPRLGPQATRSQVTSQKPRDVRISLEIPNRDDGPELLLGSRRATTAPSCSSARGERCGAELRQARGERRKGASP